MHVKVVLAVLLPIVLGYIPKNVEFDLNNIFDQMHSDRYSFINGDRCSDKVRCLMTEWDYMREFSTELSSTYQSLFWVEEPPTEWWINPDNKSPNYTVTINCRAQSYNYESEVFYEWKKSGSRGQNTLIDNSDPRVSIVSGRLNINQPKSSDAGVYRCFARNRFGSIVSRESRIRVGSTPAKRDRQTEAERRIELSTSETQLIYCENEQVAPVGIPGLEFIWKRQYRGVDNVDREEWITERSHGTKVIHPRNGYLFFIQPTIQDSGIYTCMFRNNYERIQEDGGFNWVSTYSLDVTFRSGFPTDKAPIILSVEGNIQVQRGFNLTLTCPFKAGTSSQSQLRGFSVTWELPAQRPIRAPAPMYLHGGVTLFLEKVQLYDSGDYRCTVYDDDYDQNYDDMGFKVTVYSVPFFERALPRVYPLRVGQDVVMSCEANGEPPAVYNWYKNGQQQQSALKNTYEIRMADAGKSGIYQCEATNDHGSALSTTTVRVLAMEPLFERQLPPAVDTQVTSGQGETARIHCTPFSLSAPVFQWARSNIMIQNSTGPFPKYTSYPNGTLVINNVQQDDAGNYVCKATSAGSRDNTYRLKVLPPLSLEAGEGGESGLGGGKAYTVLTNRTVDLKCRLRAPSDTDGVFVWYLNDRKIPVVPNNMRSDAERYLLKLDDIFGSDDLYYKLIRDRTFDLYNPPPYFYPENPGNPYYPTNGWSASNKQMGGVFETSRQKRQSSYFYPSSNDQFAINDVMRKAESFDPFNPYLSSEEYMRELRERHFVVMRYYETDIAWYVLDIDPLLNHYIRLENDSSSVGDLQIYRAQPWQQGQYKCCYFTAVSSSCTSLSLTVLGVPGQPGNVMFTVGDYTLRWGVPGDGGSPIISFIIEAAISPTAQISPQSFIQQQTMRPGRLQNVHKPEKEFVFVTEVQGVKNFVGLRSLVKPYCQYRFRVIARNDVGHSMPSTLSPIYPIPQGVPIVRISNITHYFGSPGDLAFQWKKLDATDFGSMSALSFKITYSEQFGSRNREEVVIENAPFLHELTISAGKLASNLNYNERRAYSVQIQFQNDRGVGPIGEVATIYTLPNRPSRAPTNVRVVSESSSSVVVMFIGIEERFQDDTFQGYIVEYWRHDVEEWDGTQRLYELSPGNRTVTRQEQVYIYDLQPSMNYKFEVFAYNLAGKGPPSEKTAGETYPIGPTEAPQNVDVFAYSSSSVRVRWTPITLVSGESQFDGYKVFYRLYGKRDSDTEVYDWKRKYQDETEAVLYGLQSGERYIVEVQPYGRGGYGDRSEPVIFLMRYTEFNPLWRDSCPSHTLNILVAALSLWSTRLASLI